MKALKSFYAKQNGQVKYFMEGKECNPDEAEKLARLKLIEIPKKTRKKAETKNAAPKKLEDK